MAGSIPGQQLIFADSDELEVKIKAENGVSSIEVKSNGKEYKFKIATTNIDELLEITSLRTGIPVDLLEGALKFEVKDRHDDDRNEDDDHNGKRDYNDDSKDGVSDKSKDAIDDSKDGVSESTLRKLIESLDSDGILDDSELEELMVENNNLRQENQILREENNDLRQQIANLNNILMEQIRVIIDTLATLRS